MGDILLILIAGAGGGLVRGIVGFIKYQFAYKDVQFKLGYIGVVMFLSAFVGLAVTWALVSSGLQVAVLEEVNPAVAFIIGYAGGDLIENLYKILAKTTSIYPLPQE
jgi:hypothetical protein